MIGCASGTLVQKSASNKLNIKNVAINSYTLNAFNLNTVTPLVVNMTPTAIASGTTTSKHYFVTGTGGFQIHVASGTCFRNYNTPSWINAISLVIGTSVWVSGSAGMTSTSITQLTSSISSTEFITLATTSSYNNYIANGFVISGSATIS